ncbi:MAG: hypothetical protein KatS3mg109_2219 [Pirellulaceae bacterium]|jgi:hypothetical protein|nr:MAG: hypothetical protein KatS3mg109_2219 [Pirellulaceae bacterium]
MLQVSIAVEGLLDEAVAKRLVRFVGAEPGPVFGKQGKSWLLQRLSGFNHAGQYAPWFVLVDLDRSADCAPPFRARVLPNPARLMCFRIAVRMVEAWLLADRKNLARFLGISSRLIPANPESLQNPKQEIIRLAQRSSNRDIRKDLVPRRGTSAPVGPAYVSRLGEFVDRHWNPEEARRHAPSLDRAIRCLEKLSRRKP